MNERVPLSYLLTQNKDEHPPVEPTVPFAAFVGEEPVIVTAVLARTVAYHRLGDRHDTGLRRPELIHVDPAVIQWRTRTAEYDGSKLLAHAKPGEGRAHIHRQPLRKRSDWSASPLAPHGGEEEGAAVRAHSDERALESQRDVDRQKEAELRFLRQHAKPAEPPSQPKEEAAVVDQGLVASEVGATNVTQEFTVTKRCRRCGNYKPRSEFAATGIYSGYCSTCEPLEKADRARARAAGEKPAHKIDTKVTRHRGRRSSKPAAPAAPVDEANGYAGIIKLLQKRDALRTELAKVNEQLQEALA